MRTVAFAMNIVGGISADSVHETLRMIRKSVIAADEYHSTTFNMKNVIVMKPEKMRPYAAEFPSISSKIAKTTSKSLRNMTALVIFDEAYTVANIDSGPAIDNIMIACRMGDIRMLFLSGTFAETKQFILANFKAIDFKYGEIIIEPHVKRRWITVNAERTYFPKECVYVYRTKTYYVPATKGDWLSFVLNVIDSYAFIENLFDWREFEKRVEEWKGQRCPPAQVARLRQQQADAHREGVVHHHMGALHVRRTQGIRD